MPITNPVFISRLVRTRACTFSNTRSLRFSGGRCRSFSVSDSTVSPSSVMPNGAWPSARICSKHIARMSHLADRRRRATASGRGRSPCVRPVVPKPGHGQRLDAVARHAEVVHRLARRPAARASSRARRRRRWTPPACRCASSRCGQAGTCVWKISSQRSSRVAGSGRHERVRRPPSRSRVGVAVGQFQVERHAAELAELRSRDAAARR